MLRITRVSMRYVYRGWPHDFTDRDAITLVIVHLLRARCNNVVAKLLSNCSV